MLHALSRWILSAWMLAACSAVSGDEPESEQDQLIATIQRMGGSVTIDDTRPDKPVVKVHLYKGKTAGIGLEPLTKLSEVNWIGLHASDITEADLAYLQRWHKLKRLGLVETHLTDASLENLRGLTTLEELYLGENAITDAGVERREQRAERGPAPLRMDVLDRPGGERRAEQGEARARPDVRVGGCGSQAQEEAGSQSASEGHRHEREILQRVADRH